MVIVTGAAVTVTVPLLFLFKGSTVVNLPAFANVNVWVWPGASTSDVNGHVAHTTWWFAVSLFVHVTESPTWTLTAAGTKPSLLMSTVTVFAGAGAATSNAIALARTIIFFN